jgi:hypothetical protein
VSWCKANFLTIVSEECGVNEIKESVSHNADWRTVQIANINTLNLAAPGHVFYPNEPAFDQAEYQRKTGWLGEQIKRLNADVVCFEEVWDESALREAIAKSGLQYSQVIAPGAELGAQGTPRVGIATRLAYRSHETHAEFGEGMAIEVPELGRYTRFERPVLQVQLRTDDDLELQVVVVHLKSKRPKFLIDATGALLEDRDDPVIVARAKISTISRTP